MSLDGIDIKPGDVIKAADLMSLVEGVRRPDGVPRGGVGINIRKSPSGQTQVIARDRLRRYLCTANGDIDPRSGSTAGTGVVIVKHYNPDDGTIFTDDTPVALDVLNASSNTMTGGAGITDGSYCWAMEDGDGNLWVSPLECS